MKLLSEINRTEFLQCNIDAAITLTKTKDKEDRKLYLLKYGTNGSTDNLSAAHYSGNRRGDGSGK